MHIPKKIILSPRALLGLSIAAYILLFSALTLWKLSNFYYDNLDLAIFNNVFFNTLHGNLFSATIHPPSYLGDHFSPIILLLLPIYALWPGPQLLLILETAIIGLSALPLYLCARSILSRSSEWLAVLIAGLFLLNPLTHNMNFFEFELLPFALFFLFWAIYAYLSERKALFIASVVFALLVREDIAFMVLAMSLVAVMDKRSRFWKILPLVTATLYATISFSITSTFAVNGSYKFLALYGWLLPSTQSPNLAAIAWSFITHPLQLIQHLLTIPNLEFILGATFPLFFLGFFKNKFWWLIVPPLAAVWLAASGGSALILMTHYGGFFLVGLFLIFMTRLKKIEGGSWPRIIPPLLCDRRLLYGVLIVTSVYAALTYGSIVPALAAFDTSNQREAKKELVSKIPDNAAVAATFELLSPLSTRENIYALHYGLLGKNQYALSDYALPSHTDYLAIDWHDMVKTIMHVHDHPSFGDEAERVPERLRSLLADFRLIDADGSLTLWERADTAQETSLAQLAPSSGRSSTADPVITGVRLEDGEARVVFALPELFDASQHYYLRVTTPDRSFLLPFAYHLFLPDRLGGSREITMRVFLDPISEDAFQLELYGWKNAQLKLGGLKNLEIVSDAELVSSYDVTR